MTTIPAGREVILKDATVHASKSVLRREVLTAENAGYDAARTIWNGMVDKRPARIVRCRGAAEIVAAVNFARTQGILLSVRGGGHNVVGTARCDGGITLDLSLMRGIRVDPVGCTARVEPGVTSNHIGSALSVASVSSPVLGWLSTTK